MAQSVPHASEAPSEFTPLIEPVASPRDEHGGTKINSRVPYYVIAMVFLGSFGAALSEAPLFRLFESVFCDKYYAIHDPSKNDHGVEESLCKVDAVQSELATFFGLMGFFDTLPCLLTGLIFAMLADKYGRKWLMLMNVVCMWLKTVWILVVCRFPQTLPIRLVWLQSVLTFFGGGNRILSSILFVMVSDVTPEAKKATIFLQISGIELGTSIIGPPLSSVLMRYSLWLALLLAVGTLFLVIPLAAILPETFPHSREGNASAAPTNKNGANDVPSSESSTSVADEDHSTTSTSTPSNKLGQLKSQLVELMREWTVLFRHKTIVLILVMVFVQTQWIVCRGLLLLYISRRYGWTIGKSTIVRSVSAAESLLLLIWLFPWLSSTLVGKGWTTVQKDALLIKFSWTSITVGILIIGLAPNIVLLFFGDILVTFGVGASGILHSLLSNQVEKDQVAKLFTAMTMIQLVGAMVGDPLLALSFSKGIEMGGGWLGLPYLLSGALFLIVAVPVSLARYGSERRGSD